MSTRTSMSMEELLSHTTWARRLAHGLVSDGAAAEDMVQDALLAATQKPPAPGSGRAWLRKVMLRRRINSVVSEQRREAREEKAAAEDAGEPPASPEAMVAIVEVQRLLAGLVLALPEPFRQSLVLRYYQELSSAEIAKVLKVPAGTIRWRLKEGLSLLRQRLDQEHGGAKAWRAMLAPVAATPSSATGISPPRSRLQVPMPTTALVFGLAALGGGAAVLWVALQTVPRPEVTAAEVPHVARESVSPARSRSDDSHLTAEVNPNDPEVNAVKGEELNRVAAFVGVGLPALLATAGQAPSPFEQQAVNVCVLAPERSAECKEALVDGWLALRKPAARHRAPMRRKMLEELIAGASVPVEKRRESCERDFAANKASWTEELVAKVGECIDRSDCDARAACLASSPSMASFARSARATRILPNSDAASSRTAIPPELRGA